VHRDIVNANSDVFSREGAKNPISTLADFIDIYKKRVEMVGVSGLGLRAARCEAWERPKRFIID